MLFIVKTTKMNKIKLTEEQIKKIIVSEITAYHGSNADFNEFDLGFVNSGNKMQAYGYGIYVALDKSAAERYGKIQYVVEIPKLNNHYLNAYKRYNKAFVMKIFNKLCSYILKTTDDYKGSENDLYQEFNSMIDEYDGLQLYGTASSYLGSDKEATYFFEKLGYKGILIDDNGSINVVIFNPKDIKVIKKEKPNE